MPSIYDCKELVTGLRTVRFSCVPFDLNYIFCCEEGYKFSRPQLSVLETWPSGISNFELEIILPEFATMPVSASQWEVLQAIVTREVEQVRAIIVEGTSALSIKLIDSKVVHDVVLERSRLLFMFYATE